MTDSPSARLEEAAAAYRRAVEAEPGILRKQTHISAADNVAARLARLARGEPVIKYKPPLNVLKDTYDHSCFLARS